MKPVVFAFCRMNPITSGHDKLVRKVAEIAKKENAMARVYLSHTQDKSKNPLPYAKKVKWAKAAFGKIIINSNKTTVIDALKELSNKGVRNLIMVAGSDRITAFQQLLNSYNKKEYDFDTIRVVSAGERDPDSDTVEGMSASKMRSFVKSGSKIEFKAGLPKKLQGRYSEIFKDVEQGMNKSIAESVDKGAPIPDDMWSLYSDMYKDTYGMRPRHGMEHLKTVGDMEKELDSLSKALKRSIEREKEDNKHFRIQRKINSAKSKKEKLLASVMKRRRSFGDPGEGSMAHALKKSGVVKESADVWKNKKGFWANAEKSGFKSKEDAQKHWNSRKEYSVPTKSLKPKAFVEGFAMPNSVAKNKTKLNTLSPEDLHDRFKRVADAAGKSIEHVSRQAAWALRKEGFGDFLSKMKNGITKIKKDGSYRGYVLSKEGKHHGYVFQPHGKKPGALNGFEANTKKVGVFDSHKEAKAQIMNHIGDYDKNNKAPMFREEATIKEHEFAKRFLEIINIYEERKPLSNSEFNRRFLELLDESKKFYSTSKGGTVRAEPYHVGLADKSAGKQYFIQHHDNPKAKQDDFEQDYHTDLGWVTHTKKNGWRSHHNDDGDYFNNKKENIVTPHKSKSDAINHLLKKHYQDAGHLKEERKPLTIAQRRKRKIDEDPSSTWGYKKRAQSLGNQVRNTTGRGHSITTLFNKDKPKPNAALEKAVADIKAKKDVKEGAVGDFVSDTYDKIHHGVTQIRKNGKIRGYIMKNKNSDNHHAWYHYPSKKKYGEYETKKIGSYESHSEAKRSLNKHIDDIDGKKIAKKSITESGPVTISDKLKKKIAKKSGVPSWKGKISKHFKGKKSC